MTTKPSLGRGNPKALGAEWVELHPFPGKVWTVAEFIASHETLLAAHEQTLVRLHVADCGQTTDFEFPLVRADHVDGGATTRSALSQPEAATSASSLCVRRSGGRSAYWPERKLKFKGCRPALDGSTYPLELLPFGATHIQRTTIPFGTLTAESVLRELLGYAFMCEQHLPIHARPVCVFEYQAAGRTLGHGLVLESRGEDRIEAHIAYPSCSVAELIAAKCAGAATAGGTPLGAELLLRDVNLWWYIEEKSRLLCTLHFHGGFRGILNSNIGNDVLLRTAEGKPELCLCDFDTFHIVTLPIIPTDHFIRAFAMHAMIEVVKGSLSIFDYLEILPESAPPTIAQQLGKVYFAKSSLWRAYARRFEQAAKALGWNPQSTRAALEIAGQTAVAADVLASCMANSHYLRSMDHDRQVYYPHN